MRIRFNTSRYFQSILLLLGVGLIVMSVACRKKKSGDDDSAPVNAMDAMPAQFAVPEPTDLDTDTPCLSMESKPVPANQRVSSAYMNNCSGCHGSAGEGRNGNPALGQLPSINGYLDVVRSGRGAMPAFPVEMISESDLAKDYDLFSHRQSELAILDTQEIPLPAPISISDAEYAQQMQVGLRAWRIPGSRGACASCHGPDGIDLAKIGYPNSAILRRSKGQGLSAQDGMAIVAMINAQRNRFQVRHACNPKSFRPLQPRGIVLGGSTAYEKDAALIGQLTEHGVDLVVPIDNLGQAQALAVSIESLNVHDVAIAIPLNRWAEDSFHGDGHKTTAEWIAELPMEPVHEFAATWVQSQNAYISNPSDANLYRLMDGVKQLSAERFTQGGVGERLAREKYRSVLLMQHMIRKNRLAMPNLHATQDLDQFAIWEGAQVANAMTRGCAQDDTPTNPFPCWNYPASFYEKMSRDPVFLLKDVGKINLPWLIAGWLTDPGLQLTEHGDAQIQHLHESAAASAMRARSESQKQESLPVHDIYMGVTRLVKSIDGVDTTFNRGRDFKQESVKGCWATTTHGLIQWRSGTLPAMTALGAANSKAFDNPLHAQMTIAAIKNIDRMILLLIQNKLKNPDPQCQNTPDYPVTIRDIVSDINKWHQASPEVADATIDSLSAAIFSLAP